MTSSKNTNALWLALIFGSLLFVLLGTGCGKKNADSKNNQATFYVDNIKASQVLSEQFNSWGYPKTKSFTFTACIKDTALLAPILGGTFIVEDEAGHTQQITSDPRGCLLWSETHDYNHFSYEGSFEVKRRITAVSPHTGSLVIDLGLNPWQNKSADLSVESVERLVRPSSTADFAASLNAQADDHAVAANRARLDLKVVNLDFISVDYKNWQIRQDLDLVVADRYRLRFQPIVVRYSPTSVTQENPIQGQMKVTLLLARESDDGEFTPDQYVTHLEKNVNLQVGGVIEDVILKFPGTIADSASRLRLFVTLDPMIEDGSLRPVSFEGVIGPLPGKTEVRLAPSNKDATELLARVENYKNSGVSSDTVLQAFEKASGYKRLESRPAANKEFQPLSYNEFDDLARQPNNGALWRGISTRLCNQIYAAKPVEKKPTTEPKKQNMFWRLLRGNRDAAEVKRLGLVNSCNMTPGKAFSIVGREFVEKIVDRAPRRTGRVYSESIVIQSGITFASRRSTLHGRNFTFSRNVTAEAGTGNLVKYLSLGTLSDFASLSAKIGVNGQWYDTYTRSIEENGATTVSATMGRTVAVDGYELAFDVLSHSCVVITPLLDTAGSSAQAQGFFVCADQPKQITAKENYFFLNQIANSASSFIDGASASEAPWRMMIRGDNVYEAFKKTMSDRRSEFILQPEVKDQAKKLDKQVSRSFVSSKLTQEFPGLLSPQAQ